MKKITNVVVLIKSTVNKDKVVHYMLMCSTHTITEE